MHSLNLGILAHVDAGKTSLTERLLYDAGVLKTLGSVDAGTTRTDSMALERRRGITIRSAVTSFAAGDVAINIIDTPGHPDFIAEVERALAVLDGAVLVLSAVEGVQPQSVVIWRALRRLGVPTIVFVNKVDRAGADPHRVLDEVRTRLDTAVLRCSRVDGAGTAAATVCPVPPECDVEALAQIDERMLDLWVDGGVPRRRDAMRVVRRAVRDGRITPVSAGSALTGAGVPDLVGLISSCLPRARVDATAEPAGAVFKIDRDEAGRHVFVRMRSGTVGLRERVAMAGRAAERVTNLRLVTPDGLATCTRAVGGQIAVLDGLQAARIGDTFGPQRPGGEHRFAPALFESVIEPADPAQRGALFGALTELADQDPLIALRLGGDGRQIVVSIFGEVQKEIIAALLAENYGIDVDFHETTIVCIERVTGTGCAEDRIKVGDNPYLAGIGLRVDPAPVGSDVRFAIEIERGSLIPAFLAATEEGVRAALRQGPAGWAVTDCVVTMTYSAYYPRQSHAHQQFNKAFSSVAADFRHLAPVVVTAALREAGTQVCEPINRFDLEVPSDTLNAALSLLGREAGIAYATEPGAQFTGVTGQIQAARIRRLTAQLPALTHGQSVFTSELDHYRPVHGTPPVRPRTGPDPGDRAMWFREMPR